MTLRDRQCKLQVQASRVSARIAAPAVVALALALTRYSATTSDHNGRSSPTTGDQQQSSGAQRTMPHKGTLGGSNRLLSSHDVAAILAIPERTVRDKWREWELPTYKIGKHLRWKERDVYAWIERQAM
jgi:excisionase family DNA binding protein